MCVCVCETESVQKLKTDDVSLRKLVLIINRGRMLWLRFLTMNEGFL